MWFDLEGYQKTHCPQIYFLRFEMSSFTFTVLGLIYFFSQKASAKTKVLPGKSFEGTGHRCILNGKDWWGGCEVGMLLEGMVLGRRHLGEEATEGK